MPKRPTDPRILSRARKLRSDMTGPERALWSILRSRQLAHLKFRRQHPLGPYVVDFYCHSARLAIELDGMSHDGTAKNDEVRTAYLQRRGVRVLRVLNDDVIQAPDAVAEWIANEAIKFTSVRMENLLAGQSPSPQPSPGGRGSKTAAPRSMENLLASQPPSPQPSPGGRGSV